MINRSMIGYSKKAKYETLLESKKRFYEIKKIRLPVSEFTL